MKHRTLRITWSMAWGLLAVPLCLLWVRSYWWYDVLYYRSNNTDVLSVISGEGAIRAVNIGSRTVWGDKPQMGLSRRQFWYEGYGGDLTELGLWKTIFRGFYSPTRNSRQVPFWIIVSPAIAIAALPWLHYRFSLRTLLIATTLVAVVLGLVSYVLGGSVRE